MWYSLVVAFPRGSVAEVVREGISGFIVKDIPGAIDAVRKLKAGLIEKLAEITQKRVFRLKKLQKSICQSFHMLSDLTLQINLSPGDIRYATITVPELLKKHQLIEKRLLVVDCCRPQKTKLVDPEKRFPKEVFKKKVEEIIDIAESFRKDGLFDEIYYLAS